MQTLRNRNGRGMLLLDEAIAKDIPSIAEAQQSEDPIVKLKFFTVTGWRWYVIGLDRESLEALCFVSALANAQAEGAFLRVPLEELAKATFFGGSLGVERDLYFEPTKLSQIVASGD